LVPALGWAAESGLESETIDKVKLTPHHDTSRGLPGLLNAEIAVAETEVFKVFVEKKWENSFLQTVRFLIGAAIHKQILGSGVPVIVAVKQDIAAVLRFAHHDFGRVILGHNFHTGRRPLAVKIERAQTAPIVSDNDSVGIKHGNNLKDKVVTQVASPFIFTHKVL
jgi:hypothetical protein